MRKAMLFVVMVWCFGVMACTPNEQDLDNEYAEEVFDSSAGVETVIGSEDWKEDVGNAEDENGQPDSETEGVDEESPSLNIEYEEGELDWKGGETELQADYLYHISEEDTLVIDFKHAGTEWENDILVLNPPQNQIITIKARENEIQLDGNYITLNKAYLIQADTGLFLLLETDEDSDMDEKLWLFALEDGKVTQCGEPIHAMLDDALVWNYNKIQCLEIVNIAERMTEAECACSKGDYIYQRRDYKIQNGKLTAVNLLTETEEIKTDLHTYQVTLFRNGETQYVVCWEVKIYKGNTLLQTIYYDHDEYVSCIPDLDKVIWEEDVNFDGVKDILVWQGHYGTHGDLGYRCYLANNDTGLYEWCPAFQEIPNPKVDSEKKLICGSSRGGATTYHDTFYRYDGNTFVLTQKDMYIWDDASEQYLQAYSLDASVAVYTNQDYALVGIYEGASGLEYSFNVYTSGDGIGECTDIGNIAVIPSDESEQFGNKGLLYKISEGQYYVDSITAPRAYYLFAELQNDVWMIEIRDRDGNVLDVLTQTEHYEY